MTDQTAYVVVGGGLAGARAAEFLAVRSRGAGAVTLVGAEPDPPYRRPAVSKECLTGDDPDDLFLRPQSYYDTMGVRTVLGVAATELDVERRMLRLDSGGDLPFDRLLVATGGTPRRLDVPGSRLDGICYLRSLADARWLRSRWASVERMLVVGGGFVGLEVAAAARSAGIAVTVVELASGPLQPVLGSEVSDVIRAIHEAHGVEFLVGDSVVGFLGDDRVIGARLASGTELSADVAVVGIGISPNTAWLEGSGVRLADGVVIDEYCASSVPGVFAAGDVARWPHRLLGEIRVEHETHAQVQGVAAAKNMLGSRTRYEATPYAWSDQFGHRLEFVGRSVGWDDLTLRHGQGASVTACYWRAGQLVGVLALDAPEVAAVARRALDSGDVSGFTGVVAG